MAKKIQTKEELQASIEKAKTEIRQGENYIKQLRRQNNQQERKQRNHRLIERGAIAESLIDGADELTNEQFKRLLQTAFNSAAVHELAAALRAESAENQTSQTD